MAGFYSTKFWRGLRRYVLARDPICATAGCNRPSVVADHVIPRSQGGADHPDNLVGRCIACHNARRGTAEPRRRGCDAAGTPLDRGHWWHAAPDENRSGLSAGTAPPSPERVSSGRRRARRWG